MLCLILYFLYRTTGDLRGMRRTVSSFTYKLAESVKALCVEITRISDFRTRATSTRVAQQSAPAFAGRKNSGDGIAKRNIPVDFTSAISLRGS